MLYIVSYDIPDTKRRTKLAKMLEDFGDRVHYSVFECILDSDLLKKMADRIHIFKYLADFENKAKRGVVTGKIVSAIIMFSYIKFFVEF